jgi:OOP family OmpA-OmpF porin
MNILRALVLVAGVATLSACADFNKFDEVAALNNASASGSPFTQRLTAEYKTLVNEELSFDDQADALHFSRKGLAAARGDAVMPEPVADWNLLEQSGAIQELTNGRTRLVNVYDRGARELQPDLSAVAQARFDCWIESQEENFKQDRINGCKREFLEVLQQLEGALPPPAPPPAPAPAPQDPFAGVDPNEQMRAENAMYLVFFDFDKYDINTGAAAVLDSVAQEVRSRNLSGLHVVGHADRSGSNSYNMRLGTRRANAIKDALAARGVSADIITTESRGEENPLVDTPDGVREPSNRRGEITFK